MSEQQPNLTAELPDSPLTPEEQAKFEGITAEFASETARPTLNPEEADTKLADILQTVQRVVPENLEQAEAIGARLGTLYETVATKEKTDALNADLVDELKEVAQKGPLNWKLNHDERALWAGVAGTNTYKALPKAVQQWTEAKLGSDMSKIALLREARDEAHKRLRLDHELTSKYGEGESVEMQKTDDDATPDQKVDGQPGEQQAEKPGAEVSPADESAPKDSRSENPLDGIVSFSANGHARRGDGKSFNDHKFISKYELEKIEAHAGQIREGLGKHERLIGIMALDNRGLGHRANGQIMSHDEVKVLNAERRAGLVAEQKAEATLDVPAPLEEDVNNGGQGRWARLKTWASKKKAELYTFAGDPVNYLKERRSEASPEKKRMTDVVVGALALGAFGVALYVYGKHGQGAELAQHHTQLNGGSGLAQHYAPLNGGSANAGEHAQVLATEHAEALAGVAVERAATAHEHIAALAKGSNPWNEVHTYLQGVGVKSPTNEQIAAVDTETMRLSGVNVAAGQDHALPVGFQLHMPSLDWLRAHGILG